MRVMTDQQRIALQHVALIAEECMHPRFNRKLPLGSVTVTVNTGYE